VTAQNTSIINAKTYKQALKNVHNVTKNGIHKVLKAYKLDALVAPNNIITSILAIAGYPAINVPAGYDELGVPFGICFGGRRNSEPALIEIAYAFEYATKIRKAPTL
jgi:amidase